MEKQKNVQTGSVITKDFCCLSAANFLLFTAFYAVMPILPFYLEEVFRVNQSVMGLILASYSIACIIIRPIAGYMIDTFRKRPLYLLGYFLFMSFFCGYAFSWLLVIFITLRFLHGLAFGLTTVSGTTIVTLILPPKRLGEGLGYYGLTNTLAMCIGPLIGMSLHRAVPYEMLFLSMAGCSALGFVMAACVTVPQTLTQRKRQFSWDNLFLSNGKWEALSLLLSSVPYGMTTAYIASYAAEISLPGNSGMFFTFMAIGLGVSRLLSGRQADRGHTEKLIVWGLCLVGVSYLMLSGVKYLSVYGGTLAFTLFIIGALVQGVSFGILHPAFNALFVRMTTADKRGAATSTYLTSWDLGIGIGVFIGGYIAQHFGGFATSYLCGTVLALLAVWVFVRYRKKL